ncbi:hypothetical protein V8D89_015943 [Ganoderma adspersum]
MMSFKTIFAVVVAATFVGTAHVSAAPASDSAQAFSGDATWYIPDGRPGACGTPIQNNDLAVALSSAQYAGGSNCFRRVQVNYQGRSVNATVMDLCAACVSGDIDLTEGTFQQLTSLDAGRIKATWDFL